MENEAAGSAISSIGCIGALISSVVFGLVGWAMGRGKGRGGLGFALGAFLGVIGLVILSFMGDSGGSYRRPPRRRHPVLRRPGVRPPLRLPRR